MSKTTLYEIANDFEKSLENLLDHDDLDLTFHSAKLLPQYAFPLGLDTVDKLAKVPSWMRNSMRNEYQMRMLRSLIDSGKKEYLS